MATYKRGTPDLPEGLKPYTFHGMEFVAAGTNQGLATCPFCKKKKFYCSLDKPLYDCKPCVIGGGPQDFIRRLWEHSTPDRSELKSFASDRGVCDPAALEAWGVRKSAIEETWIVPAWNGDHEMVNVYRYVRIEGKYRLIGTPGLSHGLFGPVEPNEKATKIYVCEGVWDGAAWREALAFTRRTDDGDLIHTTKPEQSMLHRAEVYAVPGTSAYASNWHKLFAGKSLTLMYDNDHPDKVGRCAGFEGMKSFRGKVAYEAKKPSEVWYLHWGDKGFDPDLETGYDVRDVFKEVGDKPAQRVEGVTFLLERLEVAPDEWIPSERPGKGSEPTALPLPCSNWKTLVNQWRKAMEWPAAGTGLDHGLAFILAVATSTMQEGDQLWGKLLAPASSGKSTLVEAMSLAPQYVHPVSTITGFHSGFVMKDKKKDPSLVKACDTKTLIIKDGDTLMKQGNVEQIMSEMRDIYDRVSRTHYRNDLRREYKDLSITMIICGTAALVSLDQSELGERFLSCVVMDEIDPDVERDVGRRVSRSVARNIGRDIRDKVDGNDPDKLKARQLTAGYLIYLRENAGHLLKKVGDGLAEDDDAIDRLTDLGLFVAHLRARPSSKQAEVVEREFAARLTSQFTRLACCLAVVLNEPGVTPAVLKRVERVALDTARGMSREVVADLAKFGREGCKSAGIVARLNRKSAEVRGMLDFLRKIKVVETYQKAVAGRVASPTPNWRLTERFASIYKRVISLETYG